MLQVVTEILGLARFSICVEIERIIALVLSQKYSLVIFNGEFWGDRIEYTAQAFIGQHCIE